MKLTDGTGHDHQQKPTRQLRVFGVRLPVFAGIITGGLGVLMVLTTCVSGTPARPAPPPAPATTAATTPAPARDDGHEAVSAPREAWDTIDRFLDGWLSTDPTARSEAFGGTAAADLAAGLVQTDPALVPAGQVAAVEVVSATPYSILTEARLDGGMSVRVLLEGDPDSDFGWRVTRIEPTRNGATR